MRVDPSRACPDTSAIHTLEGRSYCTRCNSDVLDLRYVTERRAKALIALERARTGHACVSLFTDAEGRASFLVEPERRRRLPVLPMAFAATVASACGTQETRTPPSRAEVAVAPLPHALLDAAAPPAVDVAAPEVETAACATRDASVAPSSNAAPDASVASASARRTRHRDSFYRGGVY